MASKTNFAPGTMVGRWTVKGLAKRKSNARYWLCICSCGKEREVRGALLRANKTSSCGCIQREVRKVHRKYAADPQQAGRAEVLRSYKNNSRQRGHEWNLDDDTFFSLVFSNCHYCGRTPGTKRSPYLTKSGIVRVNLDRIKSDYAEATSIMVNGVDRLDSKRGYVEDNCVACCKICNVAKRDLAYSEFIDWLNTIARHRNEINSIATP